MIRTFKVTFEVTLNTNRGDPEYASDECIEKGTKMMLRKAFPSGEFGPDQSMAYWDDLSYTEIKEDDEQDFMHQDGCPQKYGDDAPCTCVTG